MKTKPLVNEMTDIHKTGTRKLKQGLLFTEFYTVLVAPKGAVEYRNAKKTTTPR